MSSPVLWSRQRCRRSHPPVSETLQVAQHRRRSVRRRDAPRAAVASASASDSGVGTPYSVTTSRDGFSSVSGEATELTRAIDGVSVVVSSHCTITSIIVTVFLVVGDLAVAWPPV